MFKKMAFVSMFAAAAVVAGSDRRCAGRCAVRTDAQVGQSVGRLRGLWRPTPTTITTDESRPTHNEE